MRKELDDDGNVKLKTILIGESGVGKTNLIRILSKKAFNPNQESTVNCSFYKSEMIVDKNHYNVYLWDTIGQEKLQSLTRIFFKNSKIVVLVYDITSKVSFDQLDKWLEQVKESLGDSPVLGVLGNKKDLFMNEEVSEEEGQAYAKSIGARWGLTSAKNNRESFITFLENLIRDYDQTLTPEDNEEIKNVKKYSIVLKKENTIKKRKRKKCVFF
jgi:small GTP-binding protein